MAWDGGDHAFLLDTKTRGTHQRRGIAARLVEVAVQEAGFAGCEWLHVDFVDELAGQAHVPSSYLVLPQPQGHIRPSPV